MEKNNSGIIGAISACLYTASQLVANVLSTKIALLPLVGLAVDGGTIIYPLTFTLRDFVHKTLGKKNARKIVILSAGLNLAMVLLFYLIGKMKPDPTWFFQDAYEKILLPVFRITAASIIAQIISELIDTEIFSVVYRKMNDVLAVFASNTVALFFDSVIFCIIAFFNALPFSTVLQIILANILIKMAISIISLPSIKLIPRLAEPEEI
jgi:queuosine precursor transporter